MEWEILKECVIYLIKTFSFSQSIAELSDKERLRLINRHDHSEREFMQSDWIRATKARYRRSRMPYDIYKYRLEEMLDDDVLML